MRKYATAFLSKLARLLEFFIALMLSLGIILLCIRLASTITNIPNLDLYPNYEDLLETCFNLIIGVELIHMMYSHSPNTVFEVLLFSIARQVIVDHSSAATSIIGVCAIAILFATRKYLFCTFDHSEKNVFRATSKIKIVNKILDLSIPYEDDDTLCDLFMAHFDKEVEDIGVGACAYVGKCGLRIAKMNQGKISRIEVIHAIH